jgi:hypothetical protein
MKLGRALNVGVVVETVVGGSSSGGGGSVVYIVGRCARGLLTC